MWEKKLLLKTVGKALFEGSPPTLPLSSHWRQLAAIISLLEKILAYASMSDAEENSGLNGYKHCILGC